MKILYFSRDYTTHDHRFLTAIATREHEVYYLRLENRNPHRDEQPLPSSVNIIDWAGGKSPAKLADSFKLLNQLKKIIQKINPDIIHAGPIQSAGLLAVLSGFRPIITMSWAYDLLFDAKKNSFYRWATKKTLMNTDVLIVDSEHIGQLAVKRGFPSKKIVKFPWGIDLDLFSPDQEDGIGVDLGWNENHFVLLHNRAWEPIYGVEMFVEAFVKAAKKHSELRLLLLGDGSMAPLIRETLEKSGVMDKVYFAGQVNQVELPRYYQSADLYISASHSDGSSVSLMEALGCGTPVLISDIPGNKEWVSAGEQGWFFKDGNVEDLSAGISLASENKDHLNKMGLKARELAEKRADWHKNSEILLQSYDLTQGNYA